MSNRQQANVKPGLLITEGAGPKPIDKAQCQIRGALARVIADAVRSGVNSGKLTVVDDMVQLSQETER